MRHGICVPNLAEFADPRQVAGLARRAEDAGWDGLFVWDHVVFPPGGVYEVADPWVLLTAVALATERIRFGPMVTPVARRRPGTLARQTTSPDRLSGGRLVFSAGLGWTLPAEFGSWGEPVQPGVVAGQRESTDPYDVVITGRTKPAAAPATVEPIAAAGATWWLEGFRPQPGEYAAAVRRVEAGPPR